MQLLYKLISNLDNLERENIPFKLQPLNNTKLCKGIYLIINPDVNLVPLSAVANHSGLFPLILAIDWLPPKVGKD